MEEIFIRKEAGKKKAAVRINTVEDIPEDLKEAIKIVSVEDIPEQYLDENNVDESKKEVIRKIRQAGQAVCLDCTEGVEYAPIGSVIGYEPSEKTKSGINCWNIANAATNLVEKDGEFFTKATVNKAAKIGEELPEFLEGADVRRNEDGSWTIKVHLKMYFF